MLEAVARAKGNCPDLVRSEGGVQRSLSQNSLLGRPGGGSPLAGVWEMCPQIQNPLSAGGWDLGHFTF